MKILVIDNNSQEMSDLQVVLIRAIGCSIISENKIDNALELIRNENDLTLIIAKTKLNKVNVYEALSQEIASLKITIPIVWRKSDDVLNEKYVYFENSLELNLGMITNLIHERISTGPTSSSGFIPVKAEQFLNIDNSYSACDVYIRIDKKDSPARFIKRLHANNVFSKEEIKKYIDSGLKEFYVSADQYQDYINMISVEIIKSLKESKDEKIDYFQLNSFAFDTALERLKVFGAVDDLTINLANETIKQISKSIQKNETLSFYFKRLKNNKSTYTFFHCFFIAMLSEKLSKSFDWYSPQVKEKLVYLAYFHDISLANTNLTKINSEADIELVLLSKADKELVLNHAQKSAEILEKFKEIPFGLSQLVTEHHGSKKGMGFPENLNTAISPLTIMFMVLEDFSNAFAQSSTDTFEDIEFIFENLKNKYGNPVYTETLMTLKSVFKK